MTIKGTVVRASSIKPLITEMDFSCPKCGAQMTSKFPDGLYKPPTSCEGDGCRSRTFLPDRSLAKAVDWQKLRVQVRIEAPGAAL